MTSYKRLMAFFFVYASIAVAVSSADLLGDLLGWTSDDDGAPGRREDDDDDDDNGERSSCNCRQTVCDCCVHFNLTTIVDLGGPGCVQIKYLGQEEGVALNISYGESLLHSDTIHPGSGKKAISCLDLLSSFAQVCANFGRLERSDDGLSGCLNFYPTILGAASEHYDIGCFKMGPKGIVQDFTKTNDNFTNSSLAEEQPENAGQEEEEEEEDGGTEATFGAVQTFIEDFLGINLSASSKKKPTTTTEPTKTSTESEDVNEESEDEEETESDGRRNNL